METIVFQYKRRIEEFAERILRSYIEKVERRQPPPRAVKEINDTVWQTIVLLPFEVIILDSPLIQRLRYIRQLGVAHLIYPSSGHTRFEHSIGALNQAQRLIDSLERDSKIDSDIKKSEEWKNLLRLAALCHDVGHGFMSHVSEKAIESLNEIQDLKDALAKFFNKERCFLSEATSYFFLGSPAFNDLTELAKSFTNHPLPENYNELLKNSVINRPIHDRYPLLQELISGPFDADKLDYMTRDAHMCGIPIVTDIPRLVQKVRLVEVGKDKLPTEISCNVKGEHPSYFVQGIALSGARTLDELMIGRTLLFDKVYRHQKVRAVETMVTNIISAIVPFIYDRISILPLLLNDDDVLDLNKKHLEEKLNIEIPEEQWAKISPIVDLSNRIRERDLFVRSYSFSHNLPRDPLKEDPMHKFGLEELRRHISNPEERIRILESIITYVRKMKELIPDEIAPEISSENIDFYITLDMPAPPDQISEIARAYLVTGEEELIHFREDFAESSGWSNAYPLTRDLGYVFSIRRLAPAVFLACELTFRERYNIRTPASAIYYSKIHKGSLNNLRYKLTEKGFYKDHPNDLKAVPERLNKADIDNIINEIVNKLSIFEGYCDGDKFSRRTVRVNSERVKMFLQQFVSDEEVEAVLSIMRGIKVISRSDIHNAIHQFINNNQDFKRAYVCPIGSPKDSSNIWTYYAEDLALKYKDHLQIS